MTAPRHFAQYPTYYQEIVREIYASGRRARIPCEDFKQAKFLQLQFGAWRSALRRDLQAGHFNANDQEGRDKERTWMADLLSWADATTTRIDKETSTLILLPVEESRTARALAQVKYD